MRRLCSFVLTLLIMAGSFGVTDILEQGIRAGELRSMPVKLMEEMFYRLGSAVYYYIEDHPQELELHQCTLVNRTLSLLLGNSGQTQLTGDSHDLVAAAIIQCCQNTDMYEQPKQRGLRIDTENLQHHCLMCLRRHRKNIR